MSPKRAGLHFGEKVMILLRRNRTATPRVEPSTPNGLALLIKETNPKVYRALETGDPKLQLARKIAKALGESLDFLADPDQPVDGRTEGDRFESFAASLTPAERDALADTLSRGVRGLLAAHREAAQEGRAARPPRPTGPRQ